MELAAAAEVKRGPGKEEEKLSEEGISTLSSSEKERKKKWAFNSAPDAGKRKGEGLEIRKTGKSPFCIPCGCEN